MGSRTSGVSLRRLMLLELDTRVDRVVALGWRLMPGIEDPTVAVPPT